MSQDDLDSQFDSPDGFEERARRVGDTVNDSIRTAIGVTGLIALVTGVLILVWPGKTAAVVAFIIALYAAIAGLVNIAIGLLSRRRGGWARVGYTVLGILFFVAAIIAFANLGTTASALGVLLGVVVGALWIVEGVVGLANIGDASSKVWTVIFSILSVVAGIFVLFSPLWGASVLWMLLGISLVVLGIVQIIRAFRFGQIV